MAGKHLLFPFITFFFLSLAVWAAAAQHVGGPQLGTPGGGPVIDKTGDATLQGLISELEPRFQELSYMDGPSGKTVRYNLFAPDGMKAGEKYPLVLFMADASTPGSNARLPLTQGFGALVWATAQFQAEHPCYVLVPQFSGVAVNDAYERTDEVDAVMRLLQGLLHTRNIDPARLYATGQSMGGMISMYFNVAWPDMFAASLFVDCHWDTAVFDRLARQKFVYITAGENGKAYANARALEQAAEKAGCRVAYARWSAKLPEAEQDRLAAALLGEGAPINIINFTPKSVLPADGKGSEHMYSFDSAYKLAPVRDWLFRQSR